MCHDGVIGEGEACDGANLGQRTCASGGYAGGDLRCSSDCRSIDDSDCFNLCDLSSLNVETTTVSGTVTLNGVGWPSGGIGGSDFHHDVVFVKLDTKDEFSVSIGAGGAYSAKLLKGTYDVRFRGNESVVGNTSFSQEAILKTHCREP